MKLLETWVKAPFLKKASLLLVGECVRAIHPEVYESFSKGRVVLTSCPEAEGAAITGKIASIVTCSAPKDITVLTIEGSPHCFALHAAANEALFAISSSVPCRHFVIVDDKALEVSSESVRLGRYLHLVQKYIDKYPQVLEDLANFSLEHRWAIGKNRRQIKIKKEQH